MTFKHKNYTDEEISKLFPHLKSIQFNKYSTGIYCVLNTVLECFAYKGGYSIDLAS